MKKVLIIIPIVIVIAAATVLGLFAAGIIGNKGGEPVAQAFENSVTAEDQFFGELPEDTYFDIRADRDPSTAMDNFVIIRNNKGEKVVLKSTKLEDGTYRITAKDGFKKRSSFQIWLYAAEFVAEEYQGLTTFIFRTKGENVDSEYIEINDEIQDLRASKDETTVECVTVGDEVFYYVTFPTAANERFKKGDVFLAKQPADEDLDPALLPLYKGKIEGYEFNEIASYTALEDSEVVDGKEVVYCRLSHLDEVIRDMDVYKAFDLGAENIVIDEEAIREAIENSDLYKTIVETSEETMAETADLFSGKLPDYTVRSESPVVKIGVSWNVDLKKINLCISLSIYFTDTLVLVFKFDNTLFIEPVFDASCDFSISNMSIDLELQAGLKFRTETVVSASMTVEKSFEYTKVWDVWQANYLKKTEDVGKKNVPICKEIPFFTYNVPVWIFVLEFEVGLELNLNITAEIGFEYKYVTETEFGVTFVNGDFDTYKNFKSSNTASDLYILGKIEASAGLYARFNVTCLKIVGVGLKASVGAYAELAGQIRMEVLKTEGDGNLIMGYYLHGGVYVAGAIHLKAGFTVDLGFWSKYIGWKKDFEIFRLKYDLFELGSKYLVREAADKTIEIRGPNAEIKDVQCTAYNLLEFKDYLDYAVSVKEFDYEYLDDAEDYITFKPKEGLVLVKSSVTDEFTKQIKLKAKTNKNATCVLTFHMEAVMPTCEEPELKYDVAEGGNLTFNVKKNQSDFISLTGNYIEVKDYKVDDQGNITIFEKYLSKRELGEYKFVYNTNKGSIYLTVIVKNSTPVTVEKAEVSFNKSGKANIAFKLDLAGNYVKSVTDLDSKYFYVDKSGTMVIYALGLMDLPVGAKVFTVTSSNDTTVDLTVNITDDRAPFLYQDSFPFAKTAALRNDVPVNFEKYGYTVNKVEGNGISASDYTVTDDSVLIKASFLAEKSAGDYNFSVKFKMDKNEVSKPFSITVKDSATLLAYTSYATFDKADPADVSFTVVASGGIVLSGNNVTAQNYTIKGNEIKFKSSYLSTLAVGENKFVATCGGESATLTVKVENNVIPQLVETEDVKDGKLYLTYDKDKGGDLSFEMILGGNPIKEIISEAGVLVPVFPQYTTEETEKGTTKLTLKNTYFDAVRLGKHEYRIVTDVLNIVFTIEVINTGKPEPKSQTSLSYVKGSNAVMSVKFDSKEKSPQEVKIFGSSLSTEGSEIAQGWQWVWNAQEETITFLNGENCYAEKLDGGYYKLVFYFGDKDEDKAKWTAINIGITVSDKSAE